MKLILFAAAILLYPLTSHSQDTTAHPAVEGGIYDRPYLFQPSSRLAIGGYAETMLRSEYADGIHENISFEARRFNIFFFSSISQFIKLTSELEFEHGTEEIKLETALIDLLFHESLNVRGGIILSPLGKFNIAHDSPRNEFTDRPLVSTQIIPTTLSEAGFGLHGLFYPINDNRVTYEMYLVNGFTDDLVLSGDGTFIPAGRPTAFEEDNNGNLAFVGRVAVHPQFGGELGVSMHTGFYNSFMKDGLDVDVARRLTITAIDWGYDLGDFSFSGEYARAHIEIPVSLQGLFAERQQGVYLQLMYDVLRDLFPMFPQSVLAIGTRYDYVDMDADVRGGDTHRFSGVVNLRLVPEMIIKLDYQHNWLFDRINNESRSAVIQFGIATYF
ncbi:MAG: hypothetical protein ACKVRP_00120 [Bacteroidota bacterium]